MEEIKEEFTHNHSITDYYKYPKVNEIKKLVCKEEGKDCEECKNGYCENNSLYTEPKTMIH